MSEPDVPPVPSRTRFEAELIRQILSGAFPAGAKLPSERILASSSGLSRPVVREVLRGLGERGLVEVSPARGTFVRAPSSTHLAHVLRSVARHRQATPRDLVEAREVLEARSARAAATRADARDVTQLQGLVDAFDRAGSAIDRARLDLALHTLIARLSGNPVIEVMFGAITPLVLDLQLRSAVDPTVLSRGAPLHHTIVDAIARGDAAGAEEAMVRHVVLARELYGGDLDVALDALAEGRLEAIIGADRPLDMVIEETLASARSA